MTYAWHVHHEKLFEELTEPIEDRIRYIWENKLESEIPTRLRLLKVVKNQDAILEYESVRQKALAEYESVVQKARAEYESAEQKAWNEIIIPLHNKECPNCPWDGKTIFPEKE